MKLTRETVLLIEKKNAGAVAIAASSYDGCRNSYCDNKNDLLLSDFLLFNALIKMEPIYWSANCQSIKRLNSLAPELVNIIDSLNIKNIAIIPCQLDDTTIGVLRIETTCEEIESLAQNLYCENISQERKLLKNSVAKIFGLSRIPKNWTEYKISLTEREQEILSLFSLGESIQSTSKFLYLSKNTVNTHTKNIYRKLCATNRQQAVYKAHAFGLIDHTVTI